MWANSQDRNPLCFRLCPLCLSPQHTLAHQTNTHSCCLTPVWERDFLFYCQSQSSCVFSKKKSQKNVLAPQGNVNMHWAIHGKWACCVCCEHKWKTLQRRVDYLFVSDLIWIYCPLLKGFTNIKMSIMCLLEMGEISAPRWTVQNTWKAFKHVMLLL